MKESDHNSFILCINQSLVTASDGMNELDGFIFGIKACGELQPKGFESILNLTPELMWLCCCMLYEKDLDCFEGHPPNSHKRLLVDETINFKYCEHEEGNDKHSCIDMQTLSVHDNDW